MLDSLLLLNSINEAIIILGAASRETVGGSDAVWLKVYHAEKHLDEQVAELLAPPQLEVTDDAQTCA